MSVPTSLCVSGKITHPSQAVALEILADHRQRRVRKWWRLRAYYCVWCSGWHLTSTAKVPDRVIRNRNRRMGRWT